MSTVATRRIRATPHRTAVETWNFISELLAQGAKNESAILESVSGIAASIISDKVTKDSPIVVKGAGPRLRIYCLYDGNAIDGDDANESKLSWEPLKADWKVFLPCDAAELEWTKAALAKKTAHVVAYDAETKPGEEEGKENNTVNGAAALSINFDALKKL